MAMLLDELQFPAQPADFLAPRNIPKTALEDFENGGVGIGDISGGLNAKVWRAFTSGTAVFLEAPAVPPFVLYTGTSITEIQVTFDKAMQPFLAFVDGGVAMYRWYDVGISAFRVDTLPAGSSNPRCSVDDKRANQIIVSSVILGYMRGDSLYMRKQDDAYSIEYLLATGLIGYDLVNVGMNAVNRFQFQLV